MKTEEERGKTGQIRKKQEEKTGRNRKKPEETGRNRKKQEEKGRLA